MLDKVAVFTKKKAVAIVLTAGAVLLGLILLRSLFPSGALIDPSTPQGRERFLAGLGWEVDLSSETYRSVLVPKALEGVMEQYNQLQLAQGYDLEKHLGERCGQYTYVVTNYANYDKTVFVTLYVQGREIIAGDVHTAAADGFMHGLSREAK